ncbi:protease HtpX, partial [archaeon]|nr:protease HtpX [archaeon]
MIENHLKTVLLLGLLTGILVGVGSIWGYTGLVIGLVFAVVINFGSYFFSDK